MAPTSVAAPVRERVLGLPVDAITMEGTVAAVASAIAQRRRYHILVTNANKAWLASRDARLRAALEGAELVIPEFATVWAAGLLGRAGVVQVGGITLMKRLLPEAAARGWSCYFLGARPATVEAMVRRLRADFPALQIAGWHHGYLDEASAAAVRDELRQRRPDLLFVAMGSPLQEYFIDALPADSARVSVGVGGSFDVLAGLKRDAPAWLRGSGFEWVYRLAQDPRRLWRRYLVTNPWFVARVLRERWTERSAPRLTSAH